MDGFDTFSRGNPLFLSLRKGDSTATARMEAIADRGAIANHFKLLKEVLDEHALLESQHKSTILMNWIYP